MLTRDFSIVGVTWRIERGNGLPNYELHRLEVLESYIRTGQVTPADRLSCDGERWIAIQAIPDLAAHFRAVWQQALQREPLVGAPGPAAALSLPESRATPSPYNSLGPSASPEGLSERLPVLTDFTDDEDTSDVPTTLVGRFRSGDELLQAEEVTESEATTEPEGDSLDWLEASTILPVTAGREAGTEQDSRDVIEDGMYSFDLLGDQMTDGSGVTSPGLSGRPPPEANGREETSHTATENVDSIGVHRRAKGGVLSVGRLAPAPVRATPMPGPVRKETPKRTSRRSVSPEARATPSGYDSLGPSASPGGPPAAPPARAVPSLPPGVGPTSRAPSRPPAEDAAPAGSRLSPGVFGVAEPDHEEEEIGDPGRIGGGSFMRPAFEQSPAPPGPAAPVVGQGGVGRGPTLTGVIAEHSENVYDADTAQLAETATQPVPAPGPESLAPPDSFGPSSAPVARVPVPSVPIPHPLAPSGAFNGRSEAFVRPQTGSVPGVRPLTRPHPAVRPRSGPSLPMLILAFAGGATVMLAVLGVGLVAYVLWPDGASKGPEVEPPVPIEESAGFPGATPGTAPNPPAGQEAPLERSRLPIAGPAPGPSTSPEATPTSEPMPAPVTIEGTVPGPNPSADPFADGAGDAEVRPPDRLPEPDEATMGLPDDLDAPVPSPEPEPEPEPGPVPPPVPAAEVQSAGATPDPEPEALPELLPLTPDLPADPQVAPLPEPGAASDISEGGELERR